MTWDLGLRPLRWSCKLQTRIRPWYYWYSWYSWYSGIQTSSLRVAIQLNSAIVICRGSTPKWCQYAVYTFTCDRESAVRGFPTWTNIIDVSCTHIYASFLKIEGKNWLWWVTRWSSEYPSMYVHHVDLEVKLRYSFWCIKSVWYVPAATRNNEVVDSN